MRITVVECLYLCWFIVNEGASGIPRERKFNLELNHVNCLSFFPYIFYMFVGVFAVVLKLS